MIACGGPFRDRPYYLRSSGHESTITDLCLTQIQIKFNEVSKKKQTSHLDTPYTNDASLLQEAEDDYALTKCEMTRRYKLSRGI